MEMKIPSGAGTTLKDELNMSPHNSKYLFKLVVRKF